MIENVLDCHIVELKTRASHDVGIRQINDGYARIMLQSGTTVKLRIIAKCVDYRNGSNDIILIMICHCSLCGFASHVM